MIKVENIDVYGFEHAVRAMRNPMNSWNKSDSEYRDVYKPSHDGTCAVYDGKRCFIGEKDLGLMSNLFKAGTEHRTYARMIMVWMDIEAPLYWWKEMDRYTVGKSQVSCSTMHKIHAKEFTMDDFSCEHLPLTVGDGDHIWYNDEYPDAPQEVLSYTVSALNLYRKKYLETKDKKYWWWMIQLLPHSYNQRRTICMSYEVVFKIIKERTGHKLDEWNDFVSILKELPYVKEIMEGMPS